MKHCIIAKFMPGMSAEEKERIACEAGQLFEHVLSVDGIHAVSVHRNCIERPNRYDLMIEIDMERDALAAYDESDAHYQWKQRYGAFLAQKAIFDYE